VEVYLHAFLTSALDVEEWLALWLICYKEKEKASINLEYEGEWVGSGVRRDALEKWNVLPPPGI
jgi:hypothetical protein